MADLSPASRAALAGVHPKLVAVVQAAIAAGPEFLVEEGLRSPEVEAQHVANGTSHTSQSRHLRQADGFGHAVDLVPLVGGKSLWTVAKPLQWGFIYPVAFAVQGAACAAGLPIRWGGVWDRWLNSLARSPEALKAAVGNYCARHNGPDFLDGPHFELVG